MNAQPQTADWRSVIDPLIDAQLGRFDGTTTNRDRAAACANQLLYQWDELSDEVREGFLTASFTRFIGDRIRQAKEKVEYRALPGETLAPTDFRQLTLFELTESIQRRENHAIGVLHELRYEKAVLDAMRARGATDETHIGDMLSNDDLLTIRQEIAEAS